MKAMNVWPDSNYVLFEPLQERVADLKELRNRFSADKIALWIGAVGSNNGEALLNVSEDLDGSGIYSDNKLGARKVSVYTLDETCKASPPPYLLKLDTHGFEVPIFERAKNILPDSMAIIVEVYGFNIFSTALRFDEMTRYLESNGFRFADMFDILRRPKDEVIWQADFLFIRREHSIFLEETYN